MKVVLNENNILYVEFTVIPRKKQRNHSTRCEIFQSSELTDKSQIKELGDKDHSNRIPASVGIAMCNPKDEYNKATGKAKALDRAIKGLYSHPEQRSYRLKIWERFYDLIQTNDIAYLKGRHKYASKPRKIIEKYPKNSVASK